MDVYLTNRRTLGVGNDCILTRLKAINVDYDEVFLIVLLKQIFHNMFVVVVYIVLMCYYEDRICVCDLSFSCLQATDSKENATKRELMTSQQKSFVRCNDSAVDNVKGRALKNSNI